MKYHDDYLDLELPEGYAFHDRPNYCTWNFTRGDALVSVSILTREYAGDIERSLRSTKTVPGLEFEISGPHELKSETRRAIYIESVKEVPEEHFYNKQVQIVLSHAEFSALVVINNQSRYRVSEYIPFLESIRAATTDIETSRNTFAPERKRTLGNLSGAPRRSVRLPSRLRYLQRILDDLLSMPSEELDEFLDTSLLDQLLKQRVKGLSLAQAEVRLSADRNALKAWMEEDVEHRFVVNFVLSIMQAFGQRSQER